jgi:hypothetical protein
MDKGVQNGDHGWIKNMDSIPSMSSIPISSRWILDWKTVGVEI